MQLRHTLQCYTPKTDIVRAFPQLSISEVNLVACSLPDVVIDKLLKQIETERLKTQCLATAISEIIDPYLTRNEKS